MRKLMSTKSTREGDFVLQSEYQLPVLNLDDSHASTVPSLRASSPKSSQNSFPLNLGVTCFPVLLEEKEYGKTRVRVDPYSVNAKPPAFSQFECGTGHHAFNTGNPLVAAAFEEAEARKLSPTHISGSAP